MLLYRGILQSFLAFLIMSMVTSNANAAEAQNNGVIEGVYVAFRGYGAIEDENNLLFENSSEFAGALGLRVGKKWRVELELARRTSDIVGLNGAANVRGDHKVDSVGLHMFYDFRKGKKLRPFLGLGAGVQNREVTFAGTADNDPDFAVFANDEYNDFYADAFVGASYHLTPSFGLAAGFEYVTGRDRNIQANFRELPGINRSYNYYIGARWFIPFAKL